MELYFKDNSSDITYLSELIPFFSGYISYSILRKNGINSQTLEIIKVNSYNLRRF